MTLEPDVLDVETLVSNNTSVGGPQSYGTVSANGSNGWSSSANHSQPNTFTSLAEPVAGTAPVPLRTAVENAQRQAIEHALQATGNNWAQASRLLALDASNLHKMARKLGLK
jgi:transcriptional regulator with GAF, ATPase, and Fis domain